MRIAYILSLVICLSSCVDDYEIDNKDFEPSIVVNSLFTPDSLWTLSLCTSRNIYDPNSQFTPIVDATIIITELNGTNLCRLYHIGEGKYKSEDCAPKSERSYRLTVDSQDYGKVTATSSTPQKAIVTVQPLQENPTEDIIDFEIEEQSVLNDFYIWDLVELEVTYGANGEQIINRNIDLDIKSWVDQLAREIFDIKNKSLTSNLSASSLGSIGQIMNSNISTQKGIVILNPNSQPLTTVIETKLRVMTVSEELYKYYKSIEDYLEFQGYQSSISESSMVYDNIQGGVGIFAGYNSEFYNIPK